jgi:NAD(P)-dependent dehydrogenase (short-subunit alcohol dehydrogenase family)
MRKGQVVSKKFTGKIAIVTGGSTGMGLATMKRFVQEGMDHVFITGRRKITGHCGRRNWEERDCCTRGRCELI